MKPKHKILIMILVLFAAATAALCVLPFSDNLCVGYICFLAALAMMLSAAFPWQRRKSPADTGALRAKYGLRRLRW